MPRAADPTPDQPISRTVLTDVQLRQVKDTGHVEIREIRILPGHAAGLHVHNGPVVGSIVAGSVVYQIEGQPSGSWRPGTCSSSLRASGSRGSTPGMMASRSWRTSCCPRARRPS